MTRLELPFPPTLNTCFQNIPGRGRAVTPRYREWINEALWVLKSQRPVMHETEVSISIGLVAPDRRARDADNLIKPVLDLLVKGRVLKDDSNKYVRRVTVQWVPSGPPCVVLISQYEDIAA